MVQQRRIRGRPLAPRTVDFYRWLLKRHVLPRLGATELRHLDPTIIRRWHADLTGPQSSGVSTAAKAYRLVHAICQTALEEGELPRNPCTIRGAGLEPRTERPSLSIQDVETAAAAVDPRWRAVILVAAYCGLRTGELAALKRVNVDLRSATIHVSEAASDLAGRGRVIGPPKSEAGRRSVAIPPHIIDDLREHMEQFTGHAPDALVFVGPKGGVLRASNLGRSVWRPVRASLSLGPVHFHDLRSCAATLAAISGATTAELMRRFGHATPDMALKYQRATADRDTAVATAVSRHVADTLGIAHLRAAHS